MKHLLLFLFFNAFLHTASAQCLPHRTRLPAALKEVSGMARLPNGDFWLLNDGGNGPHLFLYDLAADSIRETRLLSCTNIDWEDLSADPAGNLYIGDFGNNFNNRRDLRIYRFHPADNSLDSIVFSYPDQTAFPPGDEKSRNFDCEAMVFFRDSLHLFSKSRFKGDHVTKHYVVPARPGHYVAELCESIRLKNRVVSGAALSRDGKTLALTSYMVGFKLGFIPFSKAHVFYFNDFTGSRFFQGKKKKVRLPKCFIARQFESVLEWSPGCWGAANEGIGPQKQSVWCIRGGFGDAN